MIDFVILVVLYNMSPNNSETLQSLANCRKVLSQFSHLVIVRDNNKLPLSPLEMKELTQVLSSINFEYWHDGHNKPLSEIYNHIISNRLNLNQTLVLWDQDSKFSQSYFEKLNAAQIEYPEIPLFLPIVKNRGNIVSPGNIIAFKGSYWKQPKLGLVHSKAHTAINSGMAIRGEYLINRFSLYDTNLKFYHTDHYFMWKYSQTESSFYVLDTIVEHDLAFESSNETFEQQAKRYKEIRKSGIYLAGLKSIWLKLLCYIYFDIFSIKIAVLRKNWKYAFLR